MIQLELIEFADLITPKEIIQELIRQIPDLQPPIPLESIAEARGIKDIQYACYDTFEAALVADKYKREGVILINNKLTGRGGRCRQRYSLGHELGHFMLPLHSHEMACTVNDITGQTDTKFEKEADEFSSHLLMPSTLLDQEPMFGEKPSLQQIRELALKYDVSYEACGKRYINHHPTPMMLIFYKDKKMKYFRKNNSFPFYFATRPKGGLPAPSESLTNKIDFKVSDHILQSKVNASIWFEERKTQRLPTNLIEEVYVQENGYSMTLLFFEKKLEWKELLVA